MDSTGKEGKISSPRRDRRELIEAREMRYRVVGGVRIASSQNVIWLDLREVRSQVLRRRANGEGNLPDEAEVSRFGIIGNPPTGSLSAPNTM